MTSEHLRELQQDLESVEYQRDEAKRRHQEAVAARQRLLRRRMELLMDFTEGGHNSERLKEAAVAMGVSLSRVYQLTGDYESTPKTLRS